MTLKTGRKLVILVLLSAVAVSLQAAERALLEGVVIRVNDRIVTLGDFETRLVTEVSQMPAPVGADLGEFAEVLFTQLVDEMILLERATQQEITVEDEAVDRAIDALREENELASEEEFQAALDAAGLNLEGLRERYRQNMLIQRAISSEVTPTEITEEELRRRYQRELDSFAVPEKVILEQVYFAAGGDESAQDARRRAQALLERVREGSDLAAEATLAGVELQQLGAIPVEDLRPNLVEALEEVPEGGLSDLMESGDGWMVVRLVERVPATHRPFEEVRETLRRQRSAEIYQDQTRGLVDRLSDEYLVETHPELVDRIVARLEGS